MCFFSHGLKEETFNERLKWRSASDIDSSSGEESCQGLAFWSTLSFFSTVDAFSIVGAIVGTKNPFYLSVLMHRDATAPFFWSA